MSAPASGDPARDAAAADDAAAEPDGERDAVPAGELVAARPAIDRLQMELARANAEKRLFGKAEPARVGRFELQGSVTTGGMGAVYRAFDPQLQREVAIKVLHPELPRSELRRDRLLVEARALARLVHPNVVAVHDAILLDDQVVIVMEWVEGQTLAQWERQRPRGFRELLPKYLQAGRGLAASHALGLVHRDFKPANAIVGDDDRVRILDFGLARFDDEPLAKLAQGSAPSEEAAAKPADAASSAPTEPGGAAARASLTSTGEVLGTLAFMAPEQLAGEQATAASDQFSFCVALYRALYGDAPYAGTTVAQLLASMRAAPSGRRTRRLRSSRSRSRTKARAVPSLPLAADADPAAKPAGATRPGDARVPAWLHRLVLRGLSPTPAERFPSMEALLDELGRERGWRRWRTPVIAAAAAGAAAVLAFELAPDHVAPPSCETGVAELAQSWGAERRAAVQQGLTAALSPASEPAYREAVTRSVLEGLDRYGAQWAAMHRAACLAHRDGAQSGAVLDLRMACLRRRKDALAAASYVLRHIAAASTGRAREVVATLPPISDCEDLEALTAAVPPPATEAARQAAAALEARLAEVVAMERLGLSTAALEQVRALEPEVEQLAYPPLLVEALLVEGRIGLGRDETLTAQAPLARAEELGLEHGLLAQAIVAAARRIFAEARTGQDPEGLLRQVAVLEPLSRRLRGDAFARPLLLNNLGVLHMARSQREQALQAFTQARQAIDPARPVDLELTIVDRNLAMLTRDAAQREQLARGAWQRYRDQLGDRHLSTLEALLAYGKYVDDPAQALPLIAQACELYRAAHPELRSLRLQCESYRGFLAYELDDRDAAAAAYEEAAAVAAGVPDDKEAMRRLLAQGWAASLRARPDEARRAFTEVLQRTVGEAWWMRARAAQALIGLALLPPAPGGRPRAEQQPEAQLERAIAILVEVSEVNEDTELKRRLALARYELTLRLARPGDETGARSRRAEELADAAIAFYRRAGAASYRRRLEALAAAP